MSDNKNWDEKQEFELAKLEFEKALQLRNFEIDNFWKRGWFFGALIIALTGAYFTLKQDNLPNWSLCISFVTFLVSLFQGFMNRGSKYWQERWEYVTKNKEKTLKINLTRTRNPKWTRTVNNSLVYRERAMIDACILAKKEGILTRSSRWSVSKLTFLVWDMLTISCFSLWLRELFLKFLIKETDQVKTEEIIIFHLVIFIYVMVFILIKGNVRESFAMDSICYYEKHPQDASKQYPLSEVYVDNKDYPDEIIKKCKN